jgi:hypothetical protein
MGNKNEINCERSFDVKSAHLTLAQLRQKTAILRLRGENSITT